MSQRVDLPPEDQLQPREIAYLKDKLFTGRSYDQKDPTGRREPSGTLRCGMTLERLIAFIETCRGTETFNKIKETCRHEGKRWYNYEVEPKRIEDIITVNAHEFNEYFIKPLTAKTGMCVALNMQDAPIPPKPEVMLSHSWSESIEEVLYLLKSVKGVELASKKVFGDDTVVWFCCFSQYQNDDIRGITVKDQVALNNFQRVIECEEVLDLMALHTTADDMYMRMWCVEELRVAAIQRKQIHFLATENYIDRYTSMGRDRGAKMICSENELQARSDPTGEIPPLTLHPDVSKAQGTGIQDVIKTINEGIGFDYLNFYVYFIRVLMLQDCLKLTRLSAGEPYMVSRYLENPTRDHTKGLFDEMTEGGTITGDQLRSKILQKYSTVQQLAYDGSLEQDDREAPRNRLSNKEVVAAINGVRAAVNELVDAVGVDYLEQRDREAPRSRVPEDSIYAIEDDLNDQRERIIAMENKLDKLERAMAMAEARHEESLKNLRIRNARNKKRREDRNNNSSEDWSVYYT